MCVCGGGTGGRGGGERGERGGGERGGYPITNIVYPGTNTTYPKN